MSGDALIQTRVNPELAELVRSEAAEHGRSVAEWLRWLIREHFDQQDQIRTQLDELDERVSTVERAVLNGKR